ESLISGRVVENSGEAISFATILISETPTEEIPEGAFIAGTTSDYEGNFKAMNTAKIIALIILIINVLYLVYNLYIYFSGGYEDAFQEFQEAMKEFEKNSK
ncbi:MAG: carboxypeptidase-like regulatory domain-containing protein, partial [Flavobacteriaceae bacterium]